MWYSGDLDGYKNISTRLKLGPFEEDCLGRTSSVERQQASDEPESPGSGKPCTLFCLSSVNVCDLHICKTSYTLFKLCNNALHDIAKSLQ